MNRDPIAIAPNCDQNLEPDMLAVEAARARILESIAPVPGILSSPIRSCLGRVLARDVCSTIDVPTSTNSAVDGYALAGTGLPTDGTAQLQVTGQALAGHPYSIPVGSGECVHIMTGAALPQGTDTVVMQEHVERRGDTVRIGPGHRLGQNVRRAGEDLARGQVALPAGTRLTPAELGLLASLGRAELQVYRRPRVAFFSTGDELRQVGEPLAEGHIYDSNRYTLHSMLERLGIEILDFGVVADQPDALRAALARAAQDADAVITTGGVSVGDADYVKQTLAELGAVDFWKIAMKPGRPFACGRLGKALFFGLPGNPVAVMVTFYQFVQPALHRLAGGRGEGLPPCFEVPCSERLRKKPGRTEFLRGILEPGADGQLQVRSTGRQGSGILSSMSKANCFVILSHERGTVQPGDRVRVQPFAGLV